MIKLPKTIRPARVDEVPKNSAVLKRLKQIDNARIVEGFSYNEKAEDNNIPFDFYSEISINYNNLWDLVITLTNLLPDISALIIGHSDSNPNYCNYINKNELIDKIYKYKKELVEDTFLEWGIIYHDKETLTEIFVSDSKYIKFWGVDFEGFKSIMSKFELHLIDDLEFIEEYPNVKEPLRLFDDSVLDTNTLINELIK